MNRNNKLDFLIAFAYWAIIISGIYLVLKYLLPISVPFILGIFIAWIVVWISRKARCTHRVPRLMLSLLIYGFVALTVILVISKSIAAVPDIIKWLQRFYELKIMPLVIYFYDWMTERISHFDPTLISTLEMLEESLLSALKGILSSVSGRALGFVSNVAAGVPSMLLSLLTMIFSTVFVVSDYERLESFAREYVPEKMKFVCRTVWEYLTNTLFVVIRSYIIIMALTFTELSILFSLFGIEHPVLKAGLIAVFDILPILGTGGIVIPWAIVSVVLGYTELGVQLLIIYVIVTVVRNYVEPKIVGTQLGLHPIISLVSMFIGLRLFGFWGMFGLPVGISFLWKEKKKRESQTA